MCLCILYFSKSDLVQVSKSFQLKADAPSQTERTFIMIKPDGVQRGLVGEIIKRFEQKGFKLVAIRSVEREGAFLSTEERDLT